MIATTSHSAVFQNVYFDGILKRISVQSIHHRRSIRAMPICKLFGGIYRNRRKIIVLHWLSVAVFIHYTFNMFELPRYKWQIITVKSKIRILSFNKIIFQENGNFCSAHNNLLAEYFRSSELKFHRFLLIITSIRVYQSKSIFSGSISTMI